MPIQAIFIAPPIAIARLGGSTVPVENYHWVDTQEPRYDGETTIAPDWTLAVEPDGSVRPYLPEAVTFRDGDMIRPVAPFFEIWARTGVPGSDPEDWRDEPLTPALLEAEGLAAGDLEIAVTAANRKAARRTGNSAVAFGTAEPLVLSGADHARRPLHGVSPAGAAPPMIPAGHSIPLGSVQMLRSAPQPTARPWPDTVSIEVMRFRFWPADGRFYGPPEAALAAPDKDRPEPAVPPENAFLDPAAGWFGKSTLEILAPPDTYDVVDQASDDGPTGASLGVVDDTCEVHFEARLSAGGRPALGARAVAFVAPPDFAPDRRPFLSLADEINDRSGDAAARNEALADGELDRWIEDFFERVYETASLFNVDFYRQARASPPRRAPVSPPPPRELPPDKLRAEDIDEGERPEPKRSMGGNDALRNPLYRLPAPGAGNPLPLSEHARMRHRALSDLQGLEALVALDGERMRAIIRPPFEVESFENGRATSMRMPPFMRQSNALPLTVAGWQYELLMRWLDKSTARPAVIAGLAPGQPTLSPSAARRRAAVLARLDAARRA